MHVLCHQTIYMIKRNVNIVILSDIHLGTYGCQAVELLKYLKSIEPKMVILNGDIIDIWQFSKRYWPAAHMMVLSQIIEYITNNVPVHFIPGNHDELLRKFKGFNLGSLTISNKLSIQVDGKKTWIFHGDAFDVVMQHSKWLAKLGAVGYDLLIHINSAMNFFAQKMGRGKLSFSKKIKNSVKSAVKFINSFEQTVCDIAASNQYDYVICGHIHHPEMKEIKTDYGSLHYLNSGDWIEHNSSLEYNDGNWILYKYADDLIAQSISIEIDPKKKSKTDAMDLMQNIMEELKIKNSNINFNTDSITDIEAA